MSGATQLALPHVPPPLDVLALHEEREALRRRVGALLAQHSRLRREGDARGASAAWREANATEGRARALSAEIRRGGDMTHAQLQAALRAEVQAAERTIRRVRELAGDGAELVIALAREAGYAARVVEGVPYLVARYHGGLVGLPSWLAADELASLAREHCGVDVDLGKLWRAMRNLAAETMRRARQRRRTNRRAA